MIRIDDALALQKARKQERNIANNQPLNKGVVNGTNIARILFPNSKNPRGRYYELKTKYKTISPSQIDIICEQTGVDPNFIFGHPSKHDKDFDRLVKFRV